MFGPLFGALGTLGRTLRRLVSGSTLLNGLAYYWPLDEQSGQRENALVDSTTVASFVAANTEYLSKASNPGFTNGNSWSFVQWVYAACNWYSPYTMGADNNISPGIWFGAWTDSKYHMEVYDAVAGESYSGIAVTDAATAKWRLMAGGWDESLKKSWVSVNGGPRSYGAALASSPNFTAINRFQIGRERTNASIVDFKSGPAGLWMRDVTDPEILALFNSGNGKSYADLTVAEKVSLVSYWDMTESSGTRADSHGSNNLTDNNTVGSATARVTTSNLTDNNTVGASNRGPLGTVANHNADNTEYLNNATLGSGVDGSAGVTITAWAYEPTNGSHAIVSLGDPGGNGWLIASVLSGAPTELYFRVDDDTQNNSATLSGWSTGAWHFLALWYNPADKKAYLSIDNGTPGATAAVINHPVFTSGADRMFMIGAYPTTFMYNGRTAEVGVWNRVLTSDERTSLFAAGNGKKYADLTTSEKVDLVSYYDLSEVSGTRADSHGANTLTDNNTVTCSNSGPQQRVAKFADAPHESLTRANFPVADISNFTIAGWSRNYGDNGLILGIMGTVNHLAYAFTGTSYNFGPGPHPSGSPANDGIWHYYAMVQDGTTAKVSVDGGDFVTSTVTQNDPGPYTMTFGVSFFTDHESGPTGVWDRALSQSDVIALFNAGVGKKYADLTAAEKVSLTAYWDLTEASGTRADSHADYDLTDVNTTLSVINAGGAMDGAAASFVSVNNEYLSGGPVLDATGDYSVAFWINITSGAAGWQFPFMAYTTTYADAPLLVQWNDLYGIYALGHAAGNDPLINDAGFTANTWHHVVVTWTASTKTMELFVDNVSKGSDSAAAEQDAPSATHVGIGGPGEAHFNGRIDEPLIYDRVLTADEITELFNLGAGKFYPFP